VSDAEQAVAYVRDIISREVPIPEGLSVIVAASLEWVYTWNRETAVRGECNCNKCLGEVIDEIRGEGGG